MVHIIVFWVQRYKKNHEMCSSGKKKERKVCSFGKKVLILHPEPKNINEYQTIKRRTKI